jgi:hypothetical protein
VVVAVALIAGVVEQVVLVVVAQVATQAAHPQLLALSIQGVEVVVLRVLRHLINQEQTAAPVSSF